MAQQGFVIGFVCLDKGGVFRRLSILMPRLMLSYEATELFMPNY